MLFPMTRTKSLQNKEHTIEKTKHKNLVAKPREKIRSSFPFRCVLNKLAGGVKKLGEVNFKLLKVEERDRQSLLEF